MAIGNDPNMAQINSQIAQLASTWRSTAQQTLAFQAYVIALGTAGLTAKGFTSGDASSILTMANYMATLAGVYQGTVQQGGTGGTGAILFNFQSALIPVTGPN